MKNPWTLAAALVVALAWIPVLLRFFRSWRERANPISLAICVLVAEAIYLPVYAAIVLPPSWPLVTIAFVGGIACGSFYIAFWWAKRRFQDGRN